MTEFRWLVTMSFAPGSIATGEGSWARLQLREQTFVMEQDRGGMFWGPWKDLPVVVEDK